MKMKKEHQELLTDVIGKLIHLNPHLIQIYEKGIFQNADKVKDLQKRFNHDMLRHGISQMFVVDVLYKYLNDDHIDSFLKGLNKKGVIPTLNTYWFDKGFLTIEQQVIKAKQEREASE